MLSHKKRRSKNKFTSVTHPLLLVQLDNVLISIIVLITQHIFNMLQSDDTNKYANTTI